MCIFSHKSRRNTRAAIETTAAYCHSFFAALRMRLSACYSDTGPAKGRIATSGSCRLSIFAVTAGIGAMFIAWPLVSASLGDVRKKNN